MKSKEIVESLCWSRKRKRGILKGAFLYFWIKSSSWFIVLETVYILIPYQHQIKRSTWIERGCMLPLYSRSFKRWQPMKMLKATTEFPGRGLQSQK